MLFNSLSFPRKKHKENGFVQGRGDTKGVGRGFWTPRFNSWVGYANKGVEGAAVEGVG